ncbi:hypothetical protein N9577_02255, partial [Gammaproteobacteria bacterium]|nr:hypothetical protein [Gammaproteobacteria bacterium]
MKIFIYINLVLFLTFSNTSISQEDGESSKQKEESWWSGAVEESQKILDKSSESLSSVMGNMMQAVDKEIENLKKDNSGRVDTQKKINGIRDFLDEYAELKEKDQTNSCVQGIFKSSVNCRVLIDEVLYEIEEIVFDGQIISYSEKIRNKRTEIQNLEIKKSNLNEDLVFAKDEEKASMFETSKEELAEEIFKIDSYINKTNE